MILCTRSVKSSILEIFTISSLLCVQFPLFVSSELGNESLVSTDEITQINAFETPILQSNSFVPSDTHLDSKPSDIIEHNVTTISTETKSNTSDEIIRSINSSHVDNQTADEQQQQQSSTTKTNRSSINSFEEWKQQQLQADLLRKGDTSSHSQTSSEPIPTNTLKGNPSLTNNPQIVSTNGLSKKGKLRKNFASASCGAKILAHNVEAQNTASILSSSPDEYMLNPCNAKIWFVIELCESIRIHNIEIANFELFSSVPKTFRVSSSDRYPTKDWKSHHLGTFNASFNRTIQSFQTIQSATYVKYVKFELLDFHGHEHYCPLSVVRVHGSNVEDEIITMEENTNLIDSKSSTSTHHGDENEEDDDDNNAPNEQQVGGIIGSAIIDLAKRVFRRPTSVRGTASTTSMTITDSNTLKTDCHSRTALNGNTINNTIQSWYRSETFKQCTAEFLHGLWSNFDTCTTYLSHNCFKLNNCCQCPLLTTNNTKSKNRVISTLNIYINPCGYYHILTSQLICKQEKPMESNQTQLKSIKDGFNHSTNEKNISISNNQSVTINEGGINLSNNKSTLKLINNSSNETHMDPTISTHSNEQTLPQNISNETATIVEPQISSNTNNQSSFHTSHVETIFIDTNLTNSSTEIPIAEETITPTTTTSPVPPMTNHNEQMLPTVSSPWVKGMPINTKTLPELFKLIEKLNFNLTLSNRYLEELSQHYVKKLDETQQTTDLLLKSSKAADKKLENVEQYLNRLEENFNQISFRLIKLEAWIPLLVLAIVCLFIWSLSTTCYIFLLRRKLKSFIRAYEKQNNVNIIEKRKYSTDDDDNNDEYSIDDISLICNGNKKRKLSTDSSDSNPCPSQRVPDLTLPKIKENGFHKHKQKFKKKHPKQTQNIISVHKRHNYLN